MHFSVGASESIMSRQQKTPQYIAASIICSHFHIVICTFRTLL